jgi:threonine synthase
MALQYLHETDGWCVNVTDIEILKSQRNLASDAGIFVEPSSAAAWAGLEKDLQDNADGKIQSESTVVVLLTGIGFKDMRTATTGLNVGRPTSCRGEIRSVEHYLNTVYYRKSASSAH